MNLATTSRSASFTKKKVTLDRNIPAPKERMSRAAPLSHSSLKGRFAIKCEPAIVTKALARMPATSAHAVGETAAHAIETTKPATSPDTFNMESLLFSMFLVRVQIEIGRA